MSKGVRSHAMGIDPMEEQFAAEHPEAWGTRREFLQRTAMTAGLAAGAGVLLGPDVVVAEAAKAQSKAALPSPRNLPIDTFVVLMMENRSFDHYLGWLPGADGRQAGLTYKDITGKSFKTAPLGQDFQGCAHPDPDHSWAGGRTQFNGGKVDGFLRSGDNDMFSISYYGKKDLPFIGHAAQAFTAYDRFFCSLLASTYPNRYYMHAGQSFGRKDNKISGVLPDETIFAALERKGVSNRYFYSDIPVSALWGAAGIARSSKVSEFYELAAAGKLPHVSFVDPSFAGEEAGTSGDEHPHGDIRVGQAFMSDVVHAFMESPQYRRGALFVVYDEWGGFFDHVRPPRVPDQRASSDPDNDFGQMGFRIPAVAVSPYLRPGHVNHTQYGFESILSMISYKFGIAPLNRRIKHANNIARSFDWKSKPRTKPPHLPDPKAVALHQCGGTTVRSLDGLGVNGPARPSEHDLAGLVDSGFLEQVGHDFQPAKAHVMFREPDAFLRNLAAAG